MDKGSKGQQTRERLLEAALQQFVANGYHGASMRQIAESAGLALGGIYNHFSSKEEILKAVILAHHPINLILPALAQHEGTTLEDFLHSAASQMLAVLNNRPELFKVFMIELQEFEGAHMPVFFEAIGPKALGFAARLQALDERLRPLPPLTIIRLVLGALLGFYISGTLLSRLPAPYGQQIGTVDDLVTMLVHGLRQSEEKA
ncbi:MAG: TetR/AcrR family transcriptional regulator [Caldilineaceae bacterium]